MKTAYVLVSPCKDEGKYIEKTLISVQNQTIKPVQWIIVDDGSTDDSMEIVSKYLPSMPFIKIIRREASAKRNVGPGVILAFNEGYQHINVAYDFICKFDVDLELPPRYFEILLQKMDHDPLLGTGSGKAYFIDPKSGERRSELCGDEASVGMTKFYRRECFEQIGGFVSEVGWDGYDCHRSRWFGWRALSWDEPELQFIHLRPMGSSQKNINKGRIRHGKGQYLIGTHPVFFLASSAFRSFKQKPYVIGTLYSIFGYVKALYDGEKRFGDKDLTKFIQSYQIRALTHGKGEAAEWAFQQRHAVMDSVSPANQR